MRFIIVLLSILSSFTAVANVDSSRVDAKTLALQKSYLQTVDCREPKRLTNMLEQSLKDNDNIATKAKKASVFEEVMMNNPSCFIQALNDLPPKVCNQIKDIFIHETFFYPRNEIKRALSKAKNYRSSCIAS